MQHLIKLVLALLAMAALSAPVAATDAGGQPVKIPLQKNLRLLVRPTLLGLVPPADSKSYGELFIRITAVEPDEARLRYEVKEAVAAADSDEETTRIRRGEITVTGLAAADAMIAPMFWPDGDMATGTSLLWLARNRFRELDGDERTVLELNFSRDEIPAEFHDLCSHIDTLRTAAGLEEGDPVYLETTAADALYPCLVNGERTALPVIRARDSLGLAEYWVLNDAANPLVLKMSFLPPEGSINADVPLGLIYAGSGYAVVEIDF